MSSLDRCLHHRGPDRQPRSYPQVRGTTHVKRTIIVHAFEEGPARFPSIPVHAFELEPATGAYTGTGIFRERMRLEVPFPVDYDLTQIKVRRDGSQ
ncbi:hypothetical protein GCM10010521_58900 [Streptomyces rameus]|uniref:Uncharacterized protein n=1 Tax=Streptomyces rameus TaxID=68261 RepID=A0ABN3V3P7_9ACTN